MHIHQFQDLYFKYRPQTLFFLKRTFIFLPNIGPISAVSEPTPLATSIYKMTSNYRITRRYLRLSVIAEFTTIGL